MTAPIFRQVERQARRMGDLINRLDVDTLKLVRQRHGEAYVEARANCFDCANTALCLQWLDASPVDAQQPTFCPNLPLFQSCKRD